MFIILFTYISLDGLIFFLLREFVFKVSVSFKGNFFYILKTLCLMFSPNTLFEMYQFGNHVKLVVPRKITGVSKHKLSGNP